MPVKSLHRIGAVILGLFIITHLGVHLVALGGAEAHIAALDAVQWIYRNPIGETLLVAVILSQVVTGGRRLRFRGVTGWARAQVASGVYLLLFLILHASAALYTHHIFGLETDFYWSAGSLAFEPIRYGFALYYFGAILAVFTHLAAAVHFGWPQAGALLPRALPWAGAAIAIAILASFSGFFYPIELPDEVAAYYRVNFGGLGVNPG